MFKVLGAGAASNRGSPAPVRKSLGPGVRALGRWILLGSVQDFNRAREPFPHKLTSSPLSSQPTVQKLFRNCSETVQSQLFSRKGNRFRANCCVASVLKRCPDANPGSGGRGYGLFAGVIMKQSIWDPRPRRTRCQNKKRKPKTHAKCITYVYIAQGLHGSVFFGVPFFLVVLKASQEENRNPFWGGP